MGGFSLSCVHQGLYEAKNKESQEVKVLSVEFVASTKGHLSRIHKTDMLESNCIAHQLP